MTYRESKARVGVGMQLVEYSVTSRLPARTHMARISLATLLAFMPAVVAFGQTSSIGKRTDVDESSAARPREAVPRPGNPILEQASLIAIPVAEPKSFAVHDLITIVVREQKKFKVDAESESQKEFELKSELDAFIKFIDRGLGSSVFTRGKPNIDYSFESKISGEGESLRKDNFTTRITAEIVDVKPNGNLVFQARNRMEHDDEVSVMTLTGTVRSEDITPANTVLSTQVANLTINVQNEGMVRDGSRRGWIPKILDSIRLF